MGRINYYNTITQAAKLDQLARCRFMSRGEFANGIAAIAGKKIVIVGCGAQGLNQGLNMRDSGCDISYTLRQSAIDSKALPPSWPSPRRPRAAAAPRPPRRRPRPPPRCPAPLWARPTGPRPHPSTL